MALRADRIVAELKDNGVTTVFRYYASGFQSSLPEKRLTREECDALLGAGLSVGVVYQFHNNELASDRRRFVRTANLRLRSGPGTDHSEIGRLRNRQNVRVMSEQGDWSQVDADEDGVADGWCSSTHLVSLSAMP
jgi:uncharacterized protein YgiM (DUF1202 family)